MPKAGIKLHMDHWKALEARRWAGAPQEWKDLAQAAYKKQLAQKKDRPEGRPLKHSTTAIEDAIREG
jgi:hypothetical protein